MSTDWLDVSSIAPRIAYTATASQTAFTVPFAFFEDEDLFVYQNGILLTLAVHYTVAGAEVETGGTVTLLTGATAADTIVIGREVAIEQTTHIPPSGPLDIAAVNIQFSKLIAIDQQLDDKIDRSLHFPDSDTTLTGELAVAATRSNKLLGFDSTGAVIYVTGPTFVATTSVGVAVVDSRATAAVTTFAISVNVVETDGLAAPGDGGGAQYIRGLVSDTGSFSDGSGVFWKPRAYVDTGDLVDKSVTLAKLYHPSGPSLLLGTDSNAALTITGAASNGGPNLIRLTVASTTTFTTGQIKTVSDVLGTIEANGTWTITVFDATHIDLQGSVFAHAYVSGGTIGGGVEEISISPGLALNGSSLAVTAAVAGSFKNLSIKVITGTTISVVADSVTVTNGTGFASIVPSGAALNMATTGLNGLDTGTIAINSWYSIWAIWNGAAGSQANIASLSATSPTMPGGYTYKARLGWVRTGSPATLLGTWQLGRRAQYVVGLSSITALPVLANSVQTTWTSLSVASLVPSTASMIGVTATSNNVLIGVAPSTSYSTTINSNASFPIFLPATATIVIASAWFILESTSIAVTLSGSNGNVSVLGWEDNI